ncbi:bifunctional metallophosphatase/5'-nucleotidase [Deinococcus sp. SL84]|uniref:bifunctional metallophosphatase/5'-nucleotidase n=1 Tax=Deinococcus sp. SL84 TaxID=2994663 RepID=UPI002275E657|nr:bifunctional metallophosphatase/5'-nucleotidase [Deinococcus sp. SL84]MCY1704110.1 bifunctional metallophosphatase/5'-nucleotidase [Deinococcus sp. SL84]
MKKLMPLISLPLLLGACTQPTRPADSTTTVTVLGLNDFHGQLEQSSFKVPDPKNPGKTVAVPAGGISALGGLVREVRAANPNTVLVGMGDLTGASPLSSSLLADEPTVIAMNKLGMSVSALGNHELDYGLSELQRFQKGGCDSTVRRDKACQFMNPFPGANYTYIAANVFDKNGARVFPAYRMVKVANLNIAFVGAVLEDTPSVVTPSGVAGLQFRDEADSINAVLPEIKRQGADAVIALIHQGGAAKSGYDQPGCTDLTGPIVDVAQRLDPAVTALMTGHTHQAYNCVVGGRTVIQGAAQSQLLQRLDLTVTRKNGVARVTGVKAANVLVDAQKYSSPELAELAAQAKAKTDPVANRVVATIGAPQISRQANAAGESALGDVIADAQLAATRAPERGGAVIAFMNPGGIRADLPAQPSTTITYGNIFAVQPFGNLLTVLTLSGAQIKTLLEQQFDNPSAGGQRILQVSEGFAYSYDLTRPAGQRVRDITLNGQPLNMAADYRVTVNSFLAEGGDNFTVLKEGRDRLGGGLDVDALSAYLQGRTVVPGPQNRITRLN